MADFKPTILVSPNGVEREVRSAKDQVQLEFSGWTSKDAHEERKTRATRSEAAKKAAATRREHQANDAAGVGAPTPPAKPAGSTPSA